MAERKNASDTDDETELLVTHSLVVEAARLVSMDDVGPTMDAAVSQSQNERKRGEEVLDQYGNVLRRKTGSTPKHYAPFREGTRCTVRPTFSVADEDLGLRLTSSQQKNDLVPLHLNTQQPFQYSVIFLMFQMFVSCHWNNRYF